MDAKHTATPWRAEESTVGNYTGFDINCAAPGNKKWIASVHSAHNLTGNESPELTEKKAQEIATAHANASFIVRACNAHDRLVVLLRQCLTDEFGITSRALIDDIERELAALSAAGA